MKPTPDAAAEHGPVPLFGTWRRAYATVVAVLATDVALLYALTQWLS